MLKLFFLHFIFFILTSQSWSVDSSLSVMKKINFTVAEVSWMHLDLSPDKKWIVFDALGDIYIVSINGGKAKRLTVGASWDIQPRFSPDGSRISFTSDRDGADNIWTMNSHGENLKQITFEKNDLVNDAIWHPKEPFIIVKKHLRDTRSLGAGELWFYHLNGGHGIQITEKANFTANAGEAEISSDGRYIYFVQASAFDYNKDVNQTIYWMDRYDSRKNKVENFIYKSGGSIRPTLSPNGQLMAYITRIRNQSKLVIKNLSDFSERILDTEIDRDQQEAWAVFGTYPRFTWFDATHILMAIKGKIHKVNIVNGTSTVIPFELDIEQQLFKTVHYKQTLDQDESESLINKWAFKSNKTIIQQSLGKIYVNKKILWNSDNLQFMPSISKSGKDIVFVTWNDKEKGAIFRISIQGKNAKKLTTQHQQYANPIFSEDEKLIAYLMGNQALNSSNLGDEDFFTLVLYDGRSHKEITTIQSRYSNRRMPTIQFSKDSKRIFYLESKGRSTVLSSIDINGQDKKEHFISSYAEEMVISPDEKYLAYKYLHKIYISPFIDNGKLIKIDAQNGQLPVQLITENSGDYLKWDWSSKTVYWTQGKYLHSFLINDSIFHSKYTAKYDSNQISIRYKIDKANGLIAFKNAKIITMDQRIIYENSSILIENNRIKAIGTDISIPKNAVIIDLKGKTIMPGMVDVHAHMHYNSNDIHPQVQWPYYANLAYGVTTTHDPSASTQLVFTQSELVKAGLMTGPRIFSTGFILYGAENTNKAVINNYQDAYRHLKRLKDLGAFSVKSYNQLRRDVRQMIIKAGHELKMNIYPEGGSTHNYNMTMILDGHTGIEHSLPIAELHTDVLNFFGNSGTAYTPTLIVAYGGMSGENYWYQKNEVWKEQRLLQFTPRALIDSRSRRRVMAPDEEYYHIQISQTAKQLQDHGVKVQLGAHGQLQGLGAHWELWSFVQGNMPIVSALETATITGAEYLGLEDELGSLKVGKLADLIVLNADPLMDIKNTENIHLIMINGKLFDHDMNQIYPEKIKRPTFLFDQRKELQNKTHCSCHF